LANKISSALSPAIIKADKSVLKLTSRTVHKTRTGVNK